MKHAQKVALVTGAAQGLGLACAERLLADGARVVLVDVQEEKVRAQAERLGENATWYAADLSEISSEMAKQIVAKAVDYFGSLDIVVNNAGIIHTADFVDFPEDAFDKVQRVNLKSPFLIGQAAARVMIEKGIKGSIINMSSINAVLANPTSVAYAVSKGGIKQLTAVMAVGLIAHGIRVNAIGPGTISTDLVMNSVMASPAQRQTILSRTPIARLGEASEVASVASFLASDDASYIVGQTIYPDGGRLILNYTVPVNE
ncbi:dehydrogenase [Pseudomonas amygdali pv. eriobotryae]|uniref:Dehydrogenase n=1 Tax=Pseudomonas amygdali pv. eriobotryae TaxID=129137 RepID=A0A0P9QKQ9_PSEA0|nr:SDR family NAD(P)-dependent oxidoreductase [Pseudomonas amygdali]KPX31910.1 Dehydrogenase [Pseudomonas amygdali pv. eriobotryae]KWS78372.1 dehydrogenase [Pseudomonas amygdali pv. eriobotryae]RML95301.1 Dehydrogenase [Pseudomonas amygdali pv. eriobotryae]RMO48405.1 Dehydrogenase [Pseudomonas amygdali pv. eriobotryae]GFZ62791.1 dehydrogenase [Pseudomonas amygdali pv. eriobotryae]